MATFLVFRLRLTGQPWSDSLATVIATAAESAKWDDDQLTITQIELDSCFISLQKKKTRGIRNEAVKRTGCRFLKNYLLFSSGMKWITKISVLSITEMPRNLK